MGLSSFAHVQISIVPPYSNGARNFLYFVIQFVLFATDLDGSNSHSSRSTVTGFTSGLQRIRKSMEKRSEGPNTG